MSDASLMLATDERGVTTLTLNRPDRHNALDRAFIDSLTQALAGLGSDTRVLVLTGAGKSFCAGADLGWMKASITLSETENTADAEALSTLLATLNTLPVPTLARVHGAAMGGGAGLVSCCDVAIASDAAIFAFPEVKLGLIPATISPYVLAAIGPRQSRRYFLSGERMDANEALRIGLVHACCSPEALDDQVELLVNELLQGGPAAQASARSLIDEVHGKCADKPLQRVLSERLATTRAGAEAQEGLTAFTERRKPAWRSE